MDTGQHNITVPFTARFSKLGHISDSTKQVWFVLHGYGQLAPYFIRKFNALTQHNICVIAPEGLSRFYLEDVSSRSRTGNNRVGASWMTREERETDIDNYIQYLDAIYDREIAAANVQVTVLGFSQGAATASRWVTNSRVLRFKKLVLWAGVFPPDMAIDTGKKILKDKETTVVYGTKDEYATESRLSEFKDISFALGISPAVITFDGGHELDEGTLLALI